MAKKKLNVDTEEIEGGEAIAESPEEIRARVIKDIEKNYGKGVIVKGREVVERPKIIVSFSPSINGIIGGGVPEGSWVILAGKYKVGKSLGALHLARKCQQPKYGNRNVYFLNVEGRLKERDIRGIPGLDQDKLFVIESTEDKILSSEDFLTIATNILHADKGCVLIIDSISSLVSEREIVGGVGTQTRGSGAILVAQFTNQMGSVVSVKKSIVICILQVTNNTSGYGSPWREKGGNAIQYQVDVKLVAEGDAKPWAATQGGVPFGQIVTWKCKSAALGPPGKSAECYIRYGEGIDEEQEIINDGKDVGLITGSTWLYLDFLKNHMNKLGVTEWTKESMVEIGARANGNEELRQIFKNKPEWFDILQNDLNNMMR